MKSVENGNASGLRKDSVVDASNANERHIQLGIVKAV